MDIDDANRIARLNKIHGNAKARLDVAYAHGDIDSANHWAQRVMRAYRASMAEVHRQIAPLRD